jgi:hypothetical protein
MKNLNPFIAGPMLQYPEQFVGRKQELRAIIGRMEGSQPTSINIVGEHQIGKSSLLYYFFLTWEQRVSQPQSYVVIYLSLQNANCQKEKDFYQAVAQKLLDCPRVKQNNNLVRLLQETTFIIFRNKPFELDRSGFSVAMEEFKRQGLLPVLCLDDFESLFASRDEERKEFDNGFYDSLRSLMDDSVLMLILTSCKALEAYEQEYRFVSSFFNVGQVIKLEELTTDEAIELTRLPSNYLGKTPALTEEEQKIAQRWGNRHPYFLQLAGSYLWEARHNRKNFKWARKQFEHQASKYKSKSKWRALYLLTPKWIWKLIAFIGGFVNFVESSIKGVTGLLIIILLILVVVGALNLDEFISILRSFLGLKN